MTKIFATLKIIWELWPQIYAFANGAKNLLHVRAKKRTDGKIEIVFEEQRDGAETDTKDDTANRAGRLDDLFK